METGSVCLSLTPCLSSGYARLQQCGDTPPGSSCRPRVRGGRWTEADPPRTARSVSVSDRDRPVRLAAGRLGPPRRSKSVDVLRETKEPVERGDSDGAPANDQMGDTVDGRSVDAMDLARSRRPSPAASGQSSVPGQLEQISGDSSESSLSSSTRRGSAGSRADGKQDTSGKVTHTEEQNHNCTGVKNAL